MTQNRSHLPESYIQQMTEMLGEEANAFLQSYNEPRTFGLRVHPLKWEQRTAARERIMQPFQLTPVPWCEEGYYYDESTRPGKHPYHAAGLYYIQEPSAMSAVALLDPQPGETILDLAAAPGGKSTQIAGRMRGQGVLVSNEIHPQRAKILAENIERMGIANAIVTSADPHDLAARFPLTFDRIMLDAPCSGEGMFRKDEGAISEWSPQHVTMCATRQWDIIQAAVTMLRVGGTIAYSTCTFNLEENEQIIERWLSTYPHFRLVKTERIWPQHHQGEGHFVAVLRKEEAALHEVDANDSSGSSSIASTSDARYMADGQVTSHLAGHSQDRRLGQHQDQRQEQRKEQRQGRGKRSGGYGGPLKKHNAKQHAAQSSAKTALADFQQWAKEALPGFSLPALGTPVQFGEELYWLPLSATAATLQDEHSLAGLRVLRPGLHLAHIRKNRIEPAHALALACYADRTASSIVNLSLDRDEQAVHAYLRGETLPVPAEATVSKGWTLVTVDGLPLGWAKAVDGILKNHLPKGLRQ
ncbi:RsmB/NOP family class I SAM-dependent RNA methyltransferase [Paenibacillus sp. 481]|uniref:RsmB/NOP family class I SAM-dependent RNA methyltransferase n=1 Tax=Paenibacillus sp. 481 TaxID=2835869 RepID=UPI001E3F342D|nr:RsmB/NOP family class I SAM-dependent RNA methyltransferase [Paenibacillus sp. 481]UHA72649.1 RsmB/NOP family class I SAM-dependent RNA methyltransferase [Paenibacillus sp. 481]